MTQRKSFFRKLTTTLTSDTGAELEQVEAIEEAEDGAELAVDVYQTPSSIIIQTMVAGVKPEDIDISITRDMVVIEGVRKQQLTTSADYLAQELYWGQFSRTVELPEEIDVESATAHESHGLLTLTLPKIDKHKHAKVKIKSI